MRDLSLNFENHNQGIAFQLLFALVAFACASPLVAQEKIADVRNGLDDESPVWVGQAVRFHIELMSSTFFSGTARFDIPQIPGCYVMKDAGSPVVSSETIESETWSVQRHGFRIYPQQVGKIEIPRFKVRFSVAPAFGKPPELQTLETEPLTFESRMPSGAENQSILITTEQLTASEKWDPNPQDQAVELEVGGAITRSIEIAALDIPGMALPEISFPEIEGLSRYPKQPFVDDKSDRGSLSGSRTDAVTYVAESPGNYVLPAMSVTWWNPDQKKLEREKFPSIQLTVRPNNSSQADMPANKTEGGAETVNRSYWIWGVATVGLIVIVMVFFRGPISKKWSEWSAQLNSTEQAVFGRFERACKSNNSKDALGRLLIWIQTTSQSTAVPTVQSLQDRPMTNSTLRQELNDLQLAAIGRLSDWQGSDLLQEMKALRRLEKDSNSGRATYLPPLNP